MTAASAGARPGLRQQAIRLEQFSIGWMLIEAGVAVTAGIIARSLALTSFGFDSVIELVSAVLVLRRLHAELAGCASRRISMTSAAQDCRLPGPSLVTAPPWC